MSESEILDLLASRGYVTIDEMESRLADLERDMQIEIDNLRDELEGN